MEWHSVYSCYAFEATRLRVTKYRTSTIDVNGTDIGSRRKHPFLPISHGDVSHETSPAAKSEEKRMFSQAMILMGHLKFSRGSTLFNKDREEMGPFHEWDSFASLF